MREQSLDKIVGDIKIHNSKIKYHEEERERLKALLVEKIKSIGEHLADTKRRGMSQEARDKIAQAQRKRWKLYRERIT